MKRWLFCALLMGCSASTAQNDAPKSTQSANRSELDVALDGLAAQIVERLNDTQKQKVAVNEFLTLKGDTTDMGKYMSEELTTRLINSGKTHVVERRLLQKVLSEQEIGASQLVDDETAARVGKMLGADTLCVGTLTDLGTAIKVNARLINAETAEVYAAASTDLPKNRAVLALLGGGGGMRPSIITGPAPDTRTGKKPPTSAGSTTMAQSAAPSETHNTGANGSGANTTGSTSPSRPAIIVGSAATGRQPVQSSLGVTHADTTDMVVYLNKSPYGSAPDMVMLRNGSSYCVKFWLNGRALRVQDGAIDVPCVPAGAKSFVKLPQFGEYQLQASGSATPSPFRGIVAYQKNHLFSHENKKKAVTLTSADFYSINP